MIVSSLVGNRTNWPCGKLLALDVIHSEVPLQVDSENERCLVQFEDSTAHWSLYKDLTKLKLPESDDLCVICKSSKSWDTNEIVLCHICEQGYHQDCLQVQD